jgi:SagB-type dehydrogenase family enzyme
VNQPTNDFVEPELDERLLSELYHENSKQWRSDLEFVERIVAASVNPMLQQLMATSRKRYPHAQRLPLPAPEVDGELAEAVGRRRSGRSFAPLPLARKHLALLLHFGGGITGTLGPDGHSQPVRASPSAGALYPVEIYVCAQRVRGLAPGIYHYDPFEPAVELVSAAPTGLALARLSHTAELADAGAVIVLTGVPARSRIKYGERAYRFMLLEAGHIAQNVLLAASSLELEALPIGGFVDSELDELLDIDGVDESSLYLLAVGRAG